MATKSSLCRQTVLHDQTVYSFLCELLTTNIYQIHKSLLKKAILNIAKQCLLAQQSEEKFLQRNKSFTFVKSFSHSSHLASYDPMPGVFWFLIYYVFLVRVMVNTENMLMLY